MKKVICLLLVCVLVIGAFAGCGPKAPEKVEITWWAFPVFATVDGVSGKYEKELAQKFMDENEGIQVNVEIIDFANGPNKIVTAIEGGTAPNVVFDAPGRVIEWGKAGHLVSVDDMVKDSGLAADITNENVLAACGDGTNYWMYPSSAAPFTMAVSKTALEEAGMLDRINMEGDRAWTTEEFVSLSKDMAAKGYKGFEMFAKSQGGDQGTRAFVPALTGAHLTDSEVSKYTMDTAEGIAAFELIEKGMKEGWLTPSIASDGGMAIKNFVTPVNNTFWCTGLWSPNVAKGNADLMKEAGMEAIGLPFPSPEGTDTSLEYLVNGYAIFKNDDAAKVAASKEFVKFLADDEVIGKETVKATNCFPVRKSFGNLYAGNADMEFYASLSEYYMPYYNTIDGYSDMRPLWYGTLQKIITGEMTGEEAAKYYNTEANKTIK